MLFGDNNKFSIEYKVTERMDDWVFGHFLFWICGQAVGNWDDSTDLKGCLNWLKNFIADNSNRYVYIKFFPVQYIPGSKNALLVTNAEITVSYRLTGAGQKINEK